MNLDLNHANIEITSLVMDCFISPFETSLLFKGLCNRFRCNAFVWDSS